MKKTTDLATRIKVLQEIQEQYKEREINNFDIDMIKKVSKWIKVLYELYFTTCYYTEIEEELKKVYTKIKNADERQNYLNMYYDKIYDKIIELEDFFDEPKKPKLFKILDKIFKLEDYLDWSKNSKLFKILDKIFKLEDYLDWSKKPKLFKILNKSCDDEKYHKTGFFELRSLLLKEKINKNEIGLENILDILYEDDKIIKDDYKIKYMIREISNWKDLIENTIINKEIKDLDKLIDKPINLFYFKYDKEILEAVDIINKKTGKDYTQLILKDATGQLTKNQYALLLRLMIVHGLDTSYLYSKYNDWFASK